MKFSLKGLILAIGTVPLAPGALAADIPNPLQIGTEGAYPPVNYIDAEGQVAGFEIDLAKEMCKRMAAECEFVVQAWDGIIPGLLAGKYDAIIASLYITDERKEKIAFSDKYYKVPTRFEIGKAND